jgi:hypothetical protein
MMGEAKDILIQQQIADEKDHLFEESWSESRKIITTVPNQTQYDPDHLNPSKGGNRASDDYWEEK